MAGKGPGIAIDAVSHGSHKRPMQDERVAVNLGERAAGGWPNRGVILSQAYAGLQAQAVGLAERAGLLPVTRILQARRPWRWLPAASWPAPLQAVDGIADLPDGVVMTAGGVGGAVGAALRRTGRQVVQIQNPRMRLNRFDLVVANRHDEISGPNVILTRTALHRVTPMVLAEARTIWMPRLADLRRPLVSVLVGGSNGRFRFGVREAEGLAAALAEMMRRDGIGVAVTPSRRTSAEAKAVLQARLAPLGGWVWDMQGDNPYFGLLACADAIVVTSDSVSMVSEAAASSVPVLVAHLPGRSRRIGLFLNDLIDSGRVRSFDGKLETWEVTPLDDTGSVAGEMCRRLRLG